MLILLTKDFVTIDHDIKENKHFVRRRRVLKTFIFITRLFLFGLIILLLARPFIELQTSEIGNPKLTLLIDSSSSMDVYDMSFMDEFIKGLEREIPLTVRQITSDNLTSDLGEEIIRHLEESTNLLLISDLRLTEGMKLNDTAIFAKTLNSSISALNLKTEKKDASVSIYGDSKAISGQEKEFIVEVNKLNIDEYNLLVKIDNKTVYNARDSADYKSFKYQFDSGTHRITAEILTEDDVAENNVFYKTVSISPKPKILYVTKTDSKLPDLLSQEYYNIEQRKIVPANLSQYFAVVIEDMNTNQIENIDALSEYIEDGNGMMVIGGMNSYDRGGYKSSKFETLLPVKIGRGEKKQGNSNIVILIDMSGSTQNVVKKNDEGNLVEVKGTKPLDVIKALAIDVIETLNTGNRVGIVAFAIPDPNSADKATFKAVKISDVKQLSSVKLEAVDKISRINRQGQSLFDVGFSGAYTLLKHETGSRNVILISDGGENVYQKVKDSGLSNVKAMAKEGIKTYTVGVGRNVDDVYLKNLAENGNGLYFPAGQENRLKILFGTPEEKKQGDEMTLFILNPTHFITKDVEPDAKMYGFNQVVPKSFARVLVTTDSGEPALTEWRYGLGKVVSLTVFSGTAGLGQLLNENSSRLITRSLNYLIDDPERKMEYKIDIPDTRMNEVANIYVTSKEYPKADIDLIKIKEDYYEGKEKVSEAGFNTLVGKEFAVNYPKEFQKLGMDKDTENLLEFTGGKLFNIDQQDDIIRHIRSISRRVRTERTFIIWPILFMIVVIYLFEIMLRKIFEHRKKI